MITYTYVCNACEGEFDVEQSINDEAYKDCPLCGTCNAIQRKIYTPFAFIKGEPTTIGHQAARNTEQMGHYEYEDRMEARTCRIKKASEKFLEETKGKTITHDGQLPWWRSGKVEGLPKKEHTIDMQEVKKIIKEQEIRIKKAPRKNKNG